MPWWCSARGSPPFAARSAAPYWLRSCYSLVAGPDTRDPAGARVRATAVRGRVTGEQLQISLTASGIGPVAKRTAEALPRPSTGMAADGAQPAAADDGQPESELRHVSAGDAPASRLAGADEIGTMLEQCLADNAGGMHLRRCPSCRADCACHACSPCIDCTAAGSCRHPASF